MSPEDYSRSPLGSSSTDPELLSGRASAQAAGRGSCSLPTTPSRANLTASFNAVQQQADEGPVLTTPAGSPKHGGARPMLPEDSTDQAGGSPPHPQAVHQEGDSPSQGASAARDTGLHAKGDAGPAEGKDSSSSSRGNGASRGVDGSPVKSRDMGSMGSSRKGSGSAGDVRASPFRVGGSSGKGSSDGGSSSRGDSNQGRRTMGNSTSSEASSSRHDGSIDNSRVALQGTPLSYKDKLLSEAPQAPASSSATASDSLSPASSVSSAQSSAGQDPDGESSGQGSKATGQNSKSKGTIGSSAISGGSGPQDGVAASHGGIPQHEGTPQHGAELAKTAMSSQAGCLLQSSSPNHSHKVQRS